MVSHPKTAVLRYFHLDQCREPNDWQSATVSVEPEGGEPTDYTAALMSKLVNHFLKKTKTNVQCDDGEAHNSACTPRWEERVFTLSTCGTQKPKPTALNKGEMKMALHSWHYNEKHYCLKKFEFFMKQKGSLLWECRCYTILFNIGKVPYYWIMYYSLLLRYLVAHVQ